MSKYDTTPAAAYRALCEMGDAPLMGDETMVDGSDQYEGMDMEAMKSMFMEELVDEITEILREFALEDRENFEANKESLFKEIEGLLRQPTLRDVEARTLVRRDNMHVA